MRQNEHQETGTLVDSQFKIWKNLTFFPLSVFIFQRSSTHSDLFNIDVSYSGQNMVLSAKCISLL